MNAEQRISAVLELLDGKVTAARLSQRLGVDESELLTWRDTWLAGARATHRARAPRRSLAVLGAVSVAALVGLGSREAYAASCAAPSLFSSLGLKYFCADDPALADEVNQNTAQLVGLIQQKVGAGWVSPDGGASTIGITTPMATVTGASNTLNVTSSTINSSATLQVQPSGGSTSFGGPISGPLTVTGQVSAPNTWVRVYNADVTITQAAPLTFAVSSYETYKIFYRGRMTTTADSRLLLRLGSNTANIGTPYRSFMSLEGSANATESDLSGMYLTRSTSNRSAFLAGEVTVYTYSVSGYFTGISRGEGFSWDDNQLPSGVFGTRSEGGLETALSGSPGAMQLAVTAANSQWAGHLTVYAIPSTP